MIYNDKFVWLHFPKCAGFKIESIFKTYFNNEKDLIQDPVGLKYDPDVSWHDSIHQRSKRDMSFVLGERTVICSFRNLPSWLISRYNFEFSRSPDRKHDPELLLEGKFLEVNGYQNHADNYAKKYLPPEILETGNIKFIRVEYFKEDFRSIFGKFIDVSKIPESELESRVNKSEQYLSEAIINELYDKNRKIYDRCPYWRSVEDIAFCNK